MRFPSKTLKEGIHRLSTSASALKASGCVRPLSNVVSSTKRKIRSTLGFAKKRHTSKHGITTSRNAPQTEVKLFPTTSPDNSVKTRLTLVPESSEDPVVHGPVLVDIDPEDEDDQIWGPIRRITDQSLIELALQHGPLVVDSDNDGLTAPSAQVFSVKEGANNRVFIVQYNDGHKACIRVPACGWGNRWTGLDATALRSQVNTMQYIKRHTNVPLPEIISYDTTFDNAIGAPYIMMSFLEGRQVSEVWFDDSSTVSLQEIRQNILKSLAEAMAELRHLSFDLMGSLHFENDNVTYAEVGPRYNINYGGCVRDSSFFEEQEKCREQPQCSSQDWMRNRLEEWKKEAFEECKKDIFNVDILVRKGMYLLYSLMLEYFPYAKATTNPGDKPEAFVLAPPDFDWQNILVDDKGVVTGILDWDRVETVPRWMGWACVPAWLSEDWATHYEWPLPLSHPPDELERYRNCYAEYLRHACGGCDDDYRFTTKSALFDNIQEAIGDTLQMEEVLHKVMNCVIPRISKHYHFCRLGSKGWATGQEEWYREKFSEFFAC